MHLHQLTIEGFRSFGKAKTIYFDDVTAFIGANNTGKTAALAALSKLFSRKRTDRLILPSDFHISDEGNEDEPRTRNMRIEAIFNFEELGTDVKSDAIPTFFMGMTMNSPGKPPILRIRLEATWEKSANPGGTIESQTYYVASADEDGKEQLVQARRSALDSIRMIYVPAVRDPKTELQAATGSMMGTLLGSIKWDEERKTLTEKLLGSISKEVLKQPGANGVGDSIKDTWKKYDYDKRYVSADLSFVGSDFNAVVKSPTVSFSPAYGSRECEIDDLGDGLRSLFHLSMIEGLINLEKDIRDKKDNIDTQFDIVLPVLTILAIEEPENHIAPHLLGDLMHRIENMGKTANCQAIVTSHSPSIIRRVNPQNIRHFRLGKETGETKCKELELPIHDEEIYKYMKESILAYPEVLFARAVVLGEGQSEEIVLPKIIQQHLGSEDSLGVSVAPLGGRHVNHFWKLLNNLNIPYVTLLDYDSERNGGGEERITYIVGQLREIGEEPPKEFESQGEQDKLRTLEKNGVFFSAPLDLDFAMLEAFPDVYKEIAGRGPRTKSGKSIKEIERETNGSSCDAEYAERIERAIEYVLHSGEGHKGGNGKSYTPEQHKLMPWYQNLFLGKRGKPTVHFQALAKIDAAELKTSTPQTLIRLVAYLGSLIGQGLPTQNESE